MNAETDTTVTPPETNIQSVDFSSEAKQNHRKIAKLPKPLRDIINSSIDDNLTAREIIQKLQASANPPPCPITEVDISRWKSTGYMRHLAHQDHLESIAASREAALEMAASNNLSLPQATLQVIAAQCFEILADFSPAAVKQKLAQDPLKYTSFLHVFARLTREIVHLEKFNDAKTKAAPEARQLDPARDLSENESLAFGSHLDRAFNRKDPRRIKTKPSQSDCPPTPTLASPELPSEGGSSIPDVPGPPSPSSPSPSHTSHSTVPTFHHSNIPSPSTPDPRLPESAITSEKHSIKNQSRDRGTKIENASSITPPNNPSIHQSNNPSPPEHCLDCHHPLPPLTPEGQRPFDRCQICNVTLPPPGTCTRPSADKCHFCGVTLPRRLPNGRRPKPTCHNCGTHLGRELFDD